MKASGSHQALTAWHSWWHFLHRYSHMSRGLIWIMTSFPRIEHQSIRDPVTAEGSLANCSSMASPRFAVTLQAFWICLEESCSDYISCIVPRFFRIGQLQSRNCQVGLCRHSLLFQVGFLHDSCSSRLVVRLEYSGTRAQLRRLTSFHRRAFGSAWPVSRAPASAWLCQEQDEARNLALQPCQENISTWLSHLQRLKWSYADSRCSTLLSGPARPMLRPSLRSRTFEYNK